MTKHETYQAAVKTFEANRTPENHAAVKAAWDAYAAPGPKPRKRAAFASRAGMRQFRERQMLATRRTR